MRRLLTPSTALTLAFTAACGALSCGSTVAPPDAAKAGEAKAECPPAPECPAQAPPAAAALDGDFLRGALSHRGLTKIEIEVRANGEVEELAVYHNDADAIPEPVRARAEERFPGATIERYETELEEGKKVFEVEVKTADGKECEVEAAANGDLLYVECVADESILSAEQKATIERIVAGGKITEVETVERPGDEKPSIGVSVEVGDATHKLDFGPDGALKRHAREIPASLEIELPI
ncbi:MAG: PepSY domain-containing protein [Myxococcales bacterium]|nr:PepSY domain-containing protein [Myxococcales bacterium]MCB9565672.1 PepSY domain-containing protein [Myxococcales bacterium]MCB9703172.1 PepSY domain-containing protein [Myxococcales bacterium]